MKQYHEHLEAILNKGTRKEPARPGMPGSISLFGYQNRYNLSEGFPILTTKKINFKNIVTELLWFLRGDTNIKYLIDNGCNIWNEDAYNYYLKLYKQTYEEFTPLTFEEFLEEVNEKVEEANFTQPYKFGDCGKQYGWLWRNWYKEESVIDTPIRIDQIKSLIEGLKSNPMGRRHIITAWNPATLDDMALNACHAFVQFNVREEVNQDDCFEHSFGNCTHYGEKCTKSCAKLYLDCQLYQRSADMFLGVPYNISSYALLTEIIAKICNMIPGEFIHTFGDSHIYDNHIDQVKEILTRDTEKYSLPKLKISSWLDNSIKEKHFDNNLQEWIESIKPTDFELEDYQSYPAIKAKLSTGLK